MGYGEDPTGVFPTQSEPSLRSGCVEPSRGRPVSRGQEGRAMPRGRGDWSPVTTVTKDHEFAILMQQEYFPYNSGGQKSK